jgi:hypothetical protein
VRYGNEAAALYLYARNVASQMPLLEYLAYYQVIEHYMPAFTRSETITRLRNMLKDPRFDYADDAAVGRLINIVLPTGRNTISEREQVAATVAACTDDETLASFLRSRPAAADALLDKKRITGVRQIDPRDANIGLGRQVAERIYDLRCRIVHSKEGFRTGTDVPLRPFGPESKRLRHDLSLIRFIAQHVLIATSTPTNWH